MQRNKETENERMGRERMSKRNTHSPTLSSLITIILIECFLFTTLQTDLAWGFRESSSLSLVGRRNSNTSSPGQILLRPRAGKRALDGALKKLLGKEAKDGAGRQVASFSEVMETTGIFGPEHDPSITRIDETKWREMVGDPGVFPYTRGNYAEGFRRKPWLSRKYSGGKTPGETNELFKRQLQQVGPHLSVAYDLPSQKGMDSDNPLAANEIGLAGVSVEGLWDFETLWRGIDLGEVSTSHTINQPAFMMFLMYLLVAERQGVPPEKLSATFQNDVLKEYLARKTHRLPLGISLRLWVEMQDTIVKNKLKGIKGTSISSYHIREAGATAEQELAFMFANDLQYMAAAMAQGLSVNDIALPTSYFVNLKQDLVEEVSKLVVFRIVRAELIQELQRQEIEATIEKELTAQTLTQNQVESRRGELIQALPKKAQFFPVMAYTGGTDATVEKPQNNIARVALKLLVGPLGMTQAINPIAYDEGFAINRPHPEQIAIDTSHMLLYEKGLTQIVDLLGGSYALVAKVRELEEAVWKELGKIAAFPTYQETLAYMGGKGPGSGEIARSSQKEAAEIVSGEKKKVGVNIGTEGAEFFPHPEEPSPDIQKAIKTQKRRLHDAKRKRDSQRVEQTLKDLEIAARDPDAKLFPTVKEALSANASIGEVMDVFVKVFGESDQAEPWEPSAPVETFTPSMRDFLGKQAETFEAGIDRKAFEGRNYLVATDLPYVTSAYVEEPGRYPFTRGINTAFPEYVITKYDKNPDPIGTEYDYFTNAVLTDGPEGFRRARQLTVSNFKLSEKEGDAERVVGNGYALREKGVSAIQELAYTFWSLERALDAAVEAGFTEEEAARHLSIFLSSHDNFGEEIAKFRAARRIWAKRLRERKLVLDDTALKLRIHARTSKSTYTTSKFMNNNARAAWETLQAVLGGVKTIRVTPSDAAFGEQPQVTSELTEQMAIDTYRIVRYETGLENIVDAVGGSYAIEGWTTHVEEEVNRILDELSQMGPEAAFRYIQKSVSQAENGRLKAMREGKIIRIGVNKFQEGPDPTPEEFLPEKARPVDFATAIVTAPDIGGLVDRYRRKDVAKAWYYKGEELANGARQALGASSRLTPMGRLVSEPYTVGLAVTPDHFDAIRAAWGNPPLSWVPEDVGVEEFEIVHEGVHLDILRQKAGHPDKTIEDFVARFGEGIQQIEFSTKDIKRALAEVKKRAGKGKSEAEGPIRVVLAKPGLDGHDRGLKIVATILQNAGMEVVYLGLLNTPEKIVQAAIQEDADAIALSIHSGAHMSYFSRVSQLLQKEKAGDIFVIGGGIIPQADREKLQNELGVGPLFGPEAMAHPEEMVNTIRVWHAWSKRPDKIRIVKPETGPREGANHTQVKFFLVRTPDGRPVLTELVEEPHQRSVSASDGGAKSGDFLLSGRAAVAEDVVQYPEQLLEDRDSEPTQIGQAFEEFVRKEVTPNSEKLDRGEIKIEDKIMGEAAELGMLGITVPEEYGGLNVKHVTKTRADMWAWYADPSFASLIRVHSGVGTKPIVMFGTEEQKRKYLPKLATGEYIGAYLLTEEAHGSDSLSGGTMLQTKAVLKQDADGTEYWEINGNKRFVTNARFSNLFTVFAMTQDEEGKWVKSVFIVERDTPGVVVEPDYHKMGLRGSSTADVKFDSVRIPKKNLLGRIGQGAEIGMSILNHGRTAVAAGSLGGSLRLFEETLRFVTERPQFGKHLSDFGAVREALANIAGSLYVQESMVLSVGGLFDGGESNPAIEAAAAKVFGSESLNRIAYEATQKHGGNGIMEEYAATRFYRDSRVMTIFEGANEILLSQVIAPQTLKYLKEKVWPEGKSILSEWKTLKETPLSSEIRLVRKAASIVEQTAKVLEERFASPEMRKLPENQSYFMAFGQMVTDLFAMTSTLSRTLRRLEKGYESEQEVRITKVFVIEAMERIQKRASRILEAKSLKKVALPTESLIPLKHEIARKVIELEKYAPDIQPATKAQDGGTKSAEELYADVVTAFGGDTAQAEEDIAERFAAMQKVSPQATREEAIARLAWEYQARPKEHVFPGDNFSFMVRAATSGAEILLLDLEDAVAVPRKELARKVIMLLIRAFRGELLTQEEINFLWETETDSTGKVRERTIINPKDRELGIPHFFNQIEGKFQLKKEFWFKEEQMILVRPNNLRTKWTAGDYAIVIRGIGHLIDGIYMPKVEGPDDVKEAVSILRAIQREQGWIEGRHKVFVLTELPGAVLSAEEILAVAPEVEEAQLGVVDYTAATGGKNAVQHDHFTYMRYPMLHLVESARATGKVAGTGITVKLTVEDTSADTEKIVKLGLHRKWSVHPNHLEGMKPHLDKFPPVVHKRLAYPEIKIEPDLLKDLDQLARESKPILPPKAFIPRETELVRSVVEVDAQLPKELERALTSNADMVVVNTGSTNATSPEWVNGLVRFFQEHKTRKLVALQVRSKQPGLSSTLSQLLGSIPDAIGVLIVSDAQTAREVREVDGLLTELERGNGLEIGSIRLGARIEKPDAVEKEAYPIASASRRLQWLFLDLPELTKEAPDDPTTKGYNYYHSAFIAATSAADVDAIDGRSAAGNLESETLLAANWGFHGKVGSRQQASVMNQIMNPQRAGVVPAKPGKETTREEKQAWDAFVERWKNSVERDLELLKVYAVADQDRQLGAVGFTDPYTRQPEIVDAASARIPYKQMERALKAGILTDSEREEYFKARERLMLALRPGGTEGVVGLLPGQRVLGHAVTMRPWMVQGFAKTSGDRNRYHLDPAYAAASRFKGQVAHGLLTLSTVLTGFEQLYPGYRIQSIQKFGFLGPVPFNDTIVPDFRGLELDAQGTTLRLNALNQDGKTVFESFVTVRPRAPNEPYQPIVSTPSDLARLKEWVQDVTPSFPAQIYDFTDPQSPRTQKVQKDLTTDLVRGTRTLFGTVSPELLSQLLAIGTMAMSSAESVPGHLLLGGKDLTFYFPLQEKDIPTATATVPAHDQIRRSKTGDPIVPVTIMILDRKGNLVFDGQVTKLMEPSAAKDGGEHGVSVRKDPRGFMVVSIDRPGFPTNALSPETLLELERLVDDANHDPNIKSLTILTGGGGHFIGGNDVRYVLENSGSEKALRDYYALTQRVALKIAGGKPSIAVVPGGAVGDGGVFAFAARYRIGGPSAYMRFPEVRRLDISSGSGGTQLIPRLIGIRNALKLLLTSEKISEGVFDEVVEDPLERAEEIADAVAHETHLDPKIKEKLERKIPEQVSERQKDEWESVFNEDGTLRQTERNRPLVAMLESRRKEGHGRAAQATVGAVAQGFIVPLEEGLEIEREIAVTQAMTEEAKSSLQRRVELADRRPWFDLYPSGVTETLTYPEVSVSEFIGESLERHPNQSITLLSGRQGEPEGRTVRYRDLAESSHRFARALYDLGVRKGDRVAIMLPDVFQNPIAIFGALEIGAIVVGMDTFSTAAELKSRLLIAKPKVIVMLDEYYPRLTEIRQEVPSLETVVLTGRSDFVKVSGEIPEESEEVKYFTRLLENSTSEVPLVEVRPEDTAVLAFTGSLKATELTHRNLVAASIQNAHWFFQDADLTGTVLMADLPYYHYYGLTTGLLMGLSRGAQMVLLPHYPREHKDAVVEALTHHPIHYLIGLPTTFDRVVDRLGQEPDLASEIELKGAISSAARLEEGTRQAFETVTGAWLRQGFGVTETSLIAHEPIGVAPFEGSVGLPLPDVEVMVVDPNIKERLALVHPGEPGELVVLGPGVFKGYWEHPEETAKVKTPEGWFRTGDLVRIDKEGRLFIVGREKNIIKVHGNQVVPLEVEEVLSKHPKIAEVAVFGIPDRDTGERVVAYIRPKSGRSLTEKEIEEYARRELSIFKVPTMIRIIGDPLPRTGVADKIDYEGLKKRAFRRHLVNSIQEGKWAWALNQLEENPLAGGAGIVAEFYLEELQEAYDMDTREPRRQSIRLFLWSLVQKPDFVGPEVKKAIERALAYWLFRDDPARFFREPIPGLSAVLGGLQKIKRGDELFEAAWQAIRKTYESLTPLDIFRVSREMTRPKADQIAGSFIFKVEMELKDPKNPFDITKNEKYVPTPEEMQQVSFLYGVSPQEALEFLRAMHDAYYDDGSVYAAIAKWIDPDHPERQIPVMIVGLQKGSTVKENIARNRGYTMPWGYGKYTRAIRMAERFRLPVISLVDVTGAWNGFSGIIEDTSGAVSRAIQVGAEKKVPGTVVVTGEGGSAGGLAATMDKTSMLSNSTRFVATPRGQFEILNLSKKVASSALETLRPEWSVLFRLDQAGQEKVLQEIQVKGGKLDKAKPGTLNPDFLIAALTESALQAGGKLPESEELGPFKKDVQDKWKVYDETFIERIIVATKADAKGSVQLGTISGIIEEPVGGAHRFPEGTYLAIGRHIASFLEETQDLSTSEILRRRYGHFRRIGSVEDRHYVVKDHSLERVKASPKDLARGRLGIQDWVELLFDRKEDGTPDFEEINANLADLDDGPVDFYKEFDSPDIFPFDDYHRRLEEARKATGSWAGLATGYGRIGGRKVIAIIKDPRFMGSSDKSSLVGEKATRAVEETIAKSEREGTPIPIVWVNTASGARQQDGPFSIDPLNKNLAALSWARAEGMEHINIDTAFMYGGDPASTSSNQEGFLLATQGTRKSFTGPRATQSVEREKEIPEEPFFTVEFLEKLGVLDGVLAISEVRDLLELYLNSVTQSPNALKMQPKLKAFLAQRERRMAAVIERERRGFAAFSWRPDWVSSRLSYLKGLKEQSLEDPEKPWMAEHLDTKTPLSAPSDKSRYLPLKPTFPKDHAVNSGPFLSEVHTVLARAHAELGYEYLVQAKIEPAIGELRQVLRFGTGQENFSPRLEQGYEKMRESLGQKLKKDPDAVAQAGVRAQPIAGLMARIQQKEASTAKDGGTKALPFLQEIVAQESLLYFP